MSTHLHLGKYYRYLFKDANLLVVIGYFEEGMRSKTLYEERYGIVPASGEAGRALEEIMAAAALAAVSLSDRESLGFTLTLSGSPHGFFCGVEPEGMICGTVCPSDADRNAAYVQRQKGKEPITQSYYQPNTDDPVTAVEAYFDQSVQVETRIALGPDHVGVLVQALPGGRFEEVSALADRDLISLFTQMASRGQLEPMGEVVIFYECRCNDDMILNMVSKLPADRQHELFGADRSITAECPRCGRGYTLEKSALAPQKRSPR